MPIQALPLSTTRLLGSSQALTEPSSLVKELIDNAIDAKATSIEVIISANTVDKIEVRDNGHGIRQDDLGCLGRRGYTSKLRAFEELKIVGRSSLGFRGEALASAVTLGHVIVMSRTEGEPVGTRVELKATGGIASQCSVSHPVGTTICVSNFLSKIPVRKETSLKNASKTVLRIKGILQSYALARINIRLNLKVLKLVNGNWSFAPRPLGTIKEAVIQVAGNDIAAQCIEKTYTSQAVHAPSISLRAFLPGPDADFHRAKGGQYVSIDLRPLSCSRGSLKKIITSYKGHISTAAKRTGRTAPKQPFLYLAISCSTDSYDPNIEPAKDEVLFDDEAVIIDLAEGLFQSLYTFPDCVVIPHGGCASKDIRAESMSDCMDRITNISTIALPTPESTPHVNYERRCEPTMCQKNQTNLMQVSAKNTESFQGTMIRDLPVYSHPVVTSEIYDTGLAAQLPFQAHPPVQESSRFSHSSNTLRLLRNSVWDDDQPFGPASSHTIAKSTHVVPFIEPAKVWVNKQHSPPFFPPKEYGGERSTAQDVLIDSQTTGLELEQSNDACTIPVQTAAYIPLGIPLSPSVTHIGPHNRAGTSRNKHALPPPVAPRWARLDTGTYQQLHLESYAKPTRSKTPIQRVSSELGHTQSALEFERRKETATAKLRKEMKCAAKVIEPAILYSDIESRTIHQNLTSLSVRPQDVPYDNEGLDKSTRRNMSDGDPRAYLVRRQKSTRAPVGVACAGSTMRRTKTLLLPLETIPNSAELHTISCTVSFHMAKVLHNMKSLCGLDEYIRSGGYHKGLIEGQAECREIKKSLNAVMQKHLALFSAGAGNID